MRLNRCDRCGEKFGLVSHSSWNRRFCSKPCRQVHQAENSRLRRWSAFFAGHGGRALEWAMSMVQLRNWSGHAENAGS
jgi:hypothetical protein